MRAASLPLTAGSAVRAGAPIARASRASPALAASTGRIGAIACGQAVSTSLRSAAPAPFSRTHASTPPAMSRASKLGAAASHVAAAGNAAKAPLDQSGFITTSVTATTVPVALEEIAEATAAGADIIELRLDFIAGLDAEADVPKLVSACTVPTIVTYRPTWEGGKYDGDEEPRLAALQVAARAGAEFVDCELLAAERFRAAGWVDGTDTKVILSNHDYAATPEMETLRGKIDAMWAAGADIVKLATTGQDITDARRMVRLLEEKRGPTIALCMGEKGQLTRILAAKFGGFLTFGALSVERQSAPGQPTVGELRDKYRLPEQNAATKVFGLIGNPVAQSKGAVLHNAAFENEGCDAVYIPFLVDDVKEFLDAFADLPDFAGFSVTIPHKENVIPCCGQIDPVAKSIGAVNTLVRQPDGSFSGTNTDWIAAISAVEEGLGGAGALEGKVAVVVGAGGAGKALAFGAKAKGADVIVTNRNFARAEELAAQVEGARAVPLEDVQAGTAGGDVLINTTSLGMFPNSLDDTPVPAPALASYQLVFDAVYNPMETKLLREAAAAGCKTVNGVEMFVGQAAEQFELFTGVPPPKALMWDVVVNASK